jgi:hypothetical protein
MNRKRIIILLVILGVIGGGTGSIFLFSNGITEQIGIQIAENYLLDSSCQLPKLTLINSQSCSIFNCWTFQFEVFSTSVYSADCSMFLPMLNTQTVEITVKWGVVSGSRVIF